MRRISACISILFALFTFAINRPLATAQTVIIPHTDRGQYSNAGFHNPTNPNYLAGEDQFGFTYRNFFVFDLAGVNRPIASAKLALSVLSVAEGPGFSSPDPSESSELHDVTTSIAALIGGIGGTSAYADLGSGVVYGSRTMTAADMGTVVEITLNPTATFALEQATGLIGLGGSLTTLGAANVEFTFGSSGNVTDTAELRLTLFPEPSSLYLLCLGAMSLLAGRKARR